MYQLCYKNNSFGLLFVDKALLAQQHTLTVNQRPSENEANHRLPHSLSVNTRVQSFLVNYIQYIYFIYSP